ncbi:MAG: molybdate ABC transporter substrate-binding protein [Bradymonadia bacterium]
MLGCREAEKRAPKTTLHVLAASSLTEAFHDLAREFEARHPDVDVRLSFAGSQILRMQIEQGATADIFASADEAHLDALVKAGLALAPRPFARNRLVVIVPSEHAPAADGLEALSQARRIVVGTEGVPIGRYTSQLLARVRELRGPHFVNAIEGHIVSREANVRLVRAKVALGEADAAVVYRTDVNEQVRAVEMPSGLDVQARYLMGRMSASAHAEVAAAFIDYARSPEGQRVLRGRGFDTFE